MISDIFAILFLSLIVAPSFRAPAAVSKDLKASGNYQDYRVGAELGEIRALAHRHADNYLSVKLAVDQLLDPGTPTEETREAVEALAAAASSMAGTAAPPSRKIAAVRTVLYQPGPWNDERPFAYDHDDPLGRNLDNKLRG